MSKETLTLEELKELGATPLQKDIKSEYFKTATLEELKELGATPIVPKKVEPIVEKIIEKTIETVIVDDEKLQELSDKLESETKANKGVFDALNNYIKEVKATIKRLEHNVMNSHTAGVSPLVTQSNGVIKSSFTSVINFIGATVQARRDGGVDVTITGGASEWGGISGTLADQTDLQDALNSKAPALGVDDNYVTDAEKIVIENTSGTNTGDNATNSQYSGLEGSKQDTLVSGTNIKTINGATILGSGDVVIPVGINEDSFGIVVDGAGVAITIGSKGTKYIPFDCTITGWDIRGDITGSCVFDVKRSGVSLAGTEKPTLSSATSNSDLALSTWTTSLTAGDVVEFIVDSASTLTRATVTILVNKI